MSCSPLIDPACLVTSLTGRVTGTVTGGLVGGVAHAIQSAVAWLVSATVSWWVQVPSPDLAAEPAVGALQRWTLPITVAVAVGATLVAAGKIALTRKANPLADVASGLLIVAATSAVGVLLPTMLLKAGDAWSAWVLARSAGGEFGSRLTAMLALTGAQPVIVITLGIVAIIMATIQAMLMLFRQAALVILAGVLPLAAVGTLAPATRGWFRRVTSWMLALIFYKPAAATVYATAFTLIGHGRNPRTILMGFAMVLLSLVALPVLMRFFTWATGSAGGPGGGGGLLGTALSGAVAVGAVHGSSGWAGGSSAADQARLLSAQLGAQGAATSAGGLAAGAGGAAGGLGAVGGAGAAAGGAVGGAVGGAASGAGAAAGMSATAAAAAGAAGGPAGLAVAAAADGAARVGQASASAMQPEGGDQP